MSASANLDLVRSILAAWARCQVETALPQEGHTEPRRTPKSALGGSNRVSGAEG